LRNITKHAQSCLVTVQLNVAPRVRLEIADNGAGFDPNRDYPGHLGLRSMRERVEKLGGQLVIDSAPGNGTRIALSL
jgi:signal transduction histidine kinase